MFSTSPPSASDEILIVRTVWDICLPKPPRARLGWQGHDLDALGWGLSGIRGSGVGSQGYSTGDRSGRRAGGRGSACSPGLARFRHEIVDNLRVRVSAIRGWASFVSSISPLGFCNTHFFVTGAVTVVTGTVTVVWVQVGAYSFEQVMGRGP
jgi:hypothetical protein